MDRVSQSFPCLDSPLSPETWAGRVAIPATGAPATSCDARLVSQIGGRAPAKGQPVSMVTKGCRRCAPCRRPTPCRLPPDWRTCNLWCFLLAVLKNIVFPWCFGVGHVKRIWKDAFRVAGAVQETWSSEMLGGQGADFLRGAAVWSIRSSVFWEDDFVRQVQHFVWPGITFSWQAQCFRDVDHKNRKTHWYEAVSSALNFPWLKEVSQNCFAFDVVTFEKWGSLAELLRLCSSQLRKWRKSRRIAAFLMLPSSKSEEVSQNR